MSITHAIITRINFTDRALLDKYLKVTKQILVPALKAQTNQNFTWLVYTNQNDIEYLKTQLDYPFTPIIGLEALTKYVKDNNTNIQTRHDCDDFMAPNYVAILQEKYIKLIKRHKTFIIHAQPTKYDIKTGFEYHMTRYTMQNTSMFLSLCQQQAHRHVLAANHRQMWKLVHYVELIPEGCVRLVIHDHNQLSMVYTNDKRVGKYFSYKSKLRLTTYHRSRTLIRTVSIKTKSD